MGSALISSSAGGLDTDELTATAGDVIKGKTAGVKGSDEPVTGTLELTGNAGTGDVLSGKTFYSSNPKSKNTGTIPLRNIGDHAVKSGLNTQGLWYYIPPGYYPSGASDEGNCWVYRSKDEIASTIGLTAGKLLKGQSVLDIAGTATSDANAATGHILSGKTAYVNGSKITGNIASMGGQTITPSSSTQTVSCSGKYMTGNIVVNAISNNYINITDGVVVF